jgi:outer membrane protein TolC
MNIKPHSIAIVVGAMFALCMTNSVSAQLSEEDQHSIRWHSADQVSTTRRLPGLVPVTVASKDAPANERLLPLDEAIRIALNHSEVIRLLVGTTAVSSGQTIYDTAIASTPIDREIARFDPVFSANSSWRKATSPSVLTIPPIGPTVIENENGSNTFSTALQRRNRTGGVAGIELRNDWNYGEFQGHQNRPALDLSYTQPLLSGAGIAANEAPIVIARLNQDRSYFQFRGSIQQLVQGVISAYWSLVAARTELWAREKQVEQAQESLDQISAKFKFDLADIGEVAQPRLALANFKALSITAKGDVIQREAALRNLLGLPPEDGSRLVPSTPPTRDRLQFDWNEMVETANRYRPDLIELHLVLYADRQRLIQADNQAQPTLDAFAIQGWNGISGRVPFQGDYSGGLERFPSWTLGFTFEVPLSLRASRANVRSNELVLARDQANIRQGLHATEHTLATTIRSLDQSYELYEAYRETRAAALTNLEVQLGERIAGRIIFLNVLQAITDWGNAVSQEASSLTQYNTALATLEQETGTILETHGITFSEDKYGSIGAWGKHFQDDCYPRSLSPQQGHLRYPEGDEPSEESFDLKDFPKEQSDDEQDDSKPVFQRRALPDESRPVESRQIQQMAIQSKAEPAAKQGIRARVKKLFTLSGR